MNIYMLDTNVFSEPTKPVRNQNVMEKLAKNINYSCISSISWAESLSGVKMMEDGKKKDALLAFLIDSIQANYTIVQFDDKAAWIYSDLISRLKKLGKPAPKFDMLIAATAIANNAILVTRNIADFEAISSVSALMTENWFTE